MKQLKRMILILCILALVMPLAATASAQVYEDTFFEGKTWDEVMERFKADHGITEDYMFTCGYRNLVTGEEYFINPDQYMDSASLYKVPINMIYSNKVYTGEISWDTSYMGYKYSYIQEAMIVNSNNELATYLWNGLGGYQQYRRILAPVCGEDPDTVDAMFYKNNFFTSKQVIFYLNELYTNSYKYPGVIDKMLLAEQNKYFKAHEHDVEIAHKYGYNTTDYHFYLNDSAIIYTEDPIAIVCFTDNASHPYEILADYCDLMIDYAQYSHKERLIREAREAEEAAIAALNAQQEQAAAQEAAVLHAQQAEQSAMDSLNNTSTGSTNGTAAVQQPVRAKSGGTSSGATLLIVLIAVLAAAAVAAVLILSRGKKLNRVWAILAVLITALALMIGPLSLKAGSNVKAVEDNPQDVVNTFFQALIAEEYKTMYDCLYEYYDLGLQNTPATQTGIQVYQALKDSYSYKLYGDSQVTKAEAVQQVLFTHLDLKALKGDLQAETEKIVEEMVAGRPANEIYDEEDKYLASFLDDAYGQAVNNLLSRSSGYMTTTGLNLKLVYSSGEWKISGDNALLNAVCGGAAF